MKKIKVKQTTWNLKPFFNGDNDSQIAKQRKIVEKESYRFIKKWKDRNDYLTDPKMLRQALDEYEKWQRYYGTCGNEDAYTNDTATSYGSTAFVDSDVFNCAIDTGAGKIWFGKNGTYYNSGDPGAGTGEIYSGLTGDLYVASRPWSNSIHEFNFG